MLWLVILFNRLSARELSLCIGKEGETLAELFINSDSELAAYMSLKVNLSEPYHFPQRVIVGVR